MLFIYFQIKLNLLQNVLGVFVYFLIALKHVSCVYLNAVPYKLLCSHSFLGTWFQDTVGHATSNLNSAAGCVVKERVCWRVMVAKEPVFNKVIGSKMGKKPQLNSKHEKSTNTTPTSAFTFLSLSLGEHCAAAVNTSTREVPWHCSANLCQ